jgi:hypothetical protein
VSFMLLFVVMCSIRFIISYTTIAHRIILWSSIITWVDQVLFQPYKANSIRSSETI